MLDDDDALFLWYGLTDERRLGLFPAGTIARDPQIYDTPRAGFESAQNLNSGLVERSCAVVIITVPPHPCYLWLMHVNELLIKSHPNK